MQDRFYHILVAHALSPTNQQPANLIQKRTNRH